MKWQRWHAVAAAAALVAVSLVAFKRCEGAPAPVDAGATLEPPARTPDDLLADVYVSSPNSSWTKLQRGVGGAMGILPATLPGVLVALTDLDVTLASELDGTAPMFGVVAGDPADPGVAFAMKLVDSRRARGILIDGDTSRFGGKDVAGMTVLVPKRQDPRDRHFVIAITPNGYLLVTRLESDLERLGPYVTRTLPGRPLPTESSAVVEVPRRAIQSVLKPKVEALWGDGRAFLLAQDERMRAERGRAPDFGDPAAIVAAVDAMLGRRIAVLGDLEKVRLALDVTDDAAVLTASLTPTSLDGPGRKWIDGMALGDAAPVLGLPATSAVAISMRDREADRQDQALELEKTITTSLGARLEDPAKVHDVIESATKARDESVAFALGLEDPAGVLLRAPIRDAAAADKAIRGVFDLAKAKPFKELLRVRDVAATSEEIAGLGKVSVLTLTREGREKPRSALRGMDAGAGGARTRPESAGVAWTTEQGTLVLAAGTEPAVTLKLGASPARKLADEPSLRRFTSAIGSDATTVIVAQPLKLDPRRANLPPAPLGIAVGKRGADAFVRIDIADALLREASRWQMGF
ncbi:MAG: hypothetical protein K0S65_3072 [Labilithrix sp.]|nr:hypothetical protein [Labilithrix sp.]